MKKIIALLLSLIMIFSFASCGKDDAADTDVKDDVSKDSSLEVTGVGATAKVTLKDDNRGTGTMANKAQVPTFTVYGDSAAINAINDRINSELVSLLEAAAAEPLQYAVSITKVVESNQYLQAITSYGNALSLDGLTVSTYIYDKVNDKEATLEDALNACGYTESSLKVFIDGLFNEKGPGGDLIKQKVLGFAFTESGYPQFFVKVTFDTGADEQSELITVVPETNTLDQTNADGSVFVVD